MDTRPLGTVSLLAGLLAAGCAKEPAPAAIRLATLVADAPVQARTARSELTDAPIAVEPDPENGGAWLSVDVPAAAWEPAFVPGTWSARVPLPRSGTPPPTGPPQRLVVDGVPWKYVARLPKPLPGVPDSSFHVLADRLYVVQEPGTPPPEHARVGVWTEHCAVGGGGSLRFPTRRFSVEALPVWPGESLELEVPLPEESWLGLHTLACGAPVPAQVDQGSLTFRVLLDGEPVLVHEQRLGLGAAYHRIRLPGGARDSATLRFEVEGPVALSAFAVPRIEPGRPLEPGPRGERSARPDVILFLADTFRADNLAAYGADAAYAPGLDDLASKCLVFARAWSPASWTLPAHASLFSGLQPYQHGVLSGANALPGEARTVAERFAAAGYRTAAITDAGFVSAAFGLPQGFEWFDSWNGGLASTLRRARAALDVDDGRPLFLFVQSYAVHAPYAASPAARAAYPELPFPEQSYRELATEQDAQDTDPERTTELEAALAALYRGGVTDFDAAVGAFLSELEERGYFGRSYLVFTSDHGESLGEHDAWYHQAGVWEQQTRVPLLLRGPGLAPGRVELGATLVDLPRTLAQLAGFDPAPMWRGRSLLTLERERPLFLFQGLAGEPSDMAVVAGGRKLVLTEEAGGSGAVEPVAAYDLRRDPDETHDLLPGGAAWPEQLEAHLESVVDDLFGRSLAASSARVGEAERRGLAELGYAGD